MKGLLFWLGFLLCLGVPAGLVIHQESLRRGSVVVYLRLAPGGVTIRGDRAELAFDLNLRPLDPSWAQQGFLRPDLDSRGVITAWGPDATAPPGERIRYSLEGSKVELQADSLTVKSVNSEALLGARYAKFYLTRDGQLSIIGLTNSTLDTL